MAADGDWCETMEEEREKEGGGEGGGGSEGELEDGPSQFVRALAPLVSVFGTVTSHPPLKNNNKQQKERKGKRGVENKEQDIRYDVFEIFICHSGYGEAGIGCALCARVCSFACHGSAWKAQQKYACSQKQKTIWKTTKRRSLQRR